MTADIWVSVFIAFFGAGVVLYLSREAKKEFKTVRIFTRILTGLIAVLFVMCILLVLNV